MKINHDVTRKTPACRVVKQRLSQRDIPGYLRNRIQWHFYPRLFILREYPLHVDIELSSHCQLNCPMCFRFHRKVENQGNMGFDSFKKIIDEISGKVFSIKFTGRGEPFMNKEFIKFIEYLKGKKFGEIAIITNGEFITEDLMHAVIDGNIDRIAFSIDGLKEEYEKIRTPMKYKEIIRIVRQLYELRNKKGRNRPFIRIQSVKTSIENEKAFLDIWKYISDEVLFLEYKDYSIEASRAEQTLYPCPLLYQRMMIHWNGSVPMCINDEYEESVMGNVLQASIKEIWKGLSFSSARDVHKKNLRAKVYKNCSICALHHKGHGKTLFNN
ncbi:radical SAM/SPASM domain-containing protein [Candidatus Omnitrophota bacterium]